MSVQLLVLGLAGVVAILAALIWSLHRLGGFATTAQDRRSWLIGVVLMLLTLVLVAVTGPLPVPVVLAVNLAAIGLLLWAWRTRRFSVDRLPVDTRHEAVRRRQWMREHVGLIVLLSALATIAIVAWSLTVALVLS